MTTTIVPPNTTTTTTTTTPTQAAPVRRTTHPITTARLVLVELRKMLVHGLRGGSSSTSP